MEEEEEQEQQQYGMGDLRHYIDGRNLFPAISQPPPQPPEFLSCSHPNPYDLLIFRPDSGAVIAPNSDIHSLAAGLEVGGGGGAGRWPRQETLSLLEVRSRLDPKFKEANQKGPLWEEVSRIMMEEHGYQRSGKKCREKFENLYKYYKKTKDGKTGRHDGKHYRFFRQLEALYGDSNSSSATANPNFHSDINLQEPYPVAASHSVPDSSCDYDTTTTSSYCSDANESRMRKRKAKMEMEASIDAQMRSIMEKQEAWMEKMTAVIEAKEHERLLREEQWRHRDAARIDGEHKMWAAERAWVGARDAALMAAFNKLAGKSQLHPRPPPPPCEAAAWQESDVARPFQLRSGMNLRSQEINGASEESAWGDDNIAAKMAASTSADGGGGRSGAINDYAMECSKKRKESINANRGFTYASDQNHGGEAIAGEGVEDATRLHGGGSGEYANDGLLRYLMGDSYRRL